MLVSLALALGGLVIIVIAYFAARGKIPPNQIVGIRTPIMLTVDGAWEYGHKVALPYMSSAGLLCIAAAIVNLFPMSAGGVAVFSFVTIAFVSTLLVVGTVVAGRRVERDFPYESSERDSVSGSKDR